MKIVPDVRPVAQTPEEPPWPHAPSFLPFCATQEIMAKFYGCGAPLPLGIQGLRVLDLGSGTGRDCYICANLVGESGSVIGVDMTDEQLAVANKYTDSYCKDLGYKKTNLRFVKGHIEYLDQAVRSDALRPNCPDPNALRSSSGLHPRRASPTRVSTL